MAENKEQQSQMPGVLGSLDGIMKWALEKLGGILKLGVGVGAATTAVVNDQGRAAVTEFAGSVQDLGKRLFGWAKSEGRSIVEQGGIYLVYKWLIDPLITLFVVLTFVHWGSTYFVLQLVLWLVVTVVQVLFCIRHAPGVALAGIMKGLASKSFKAPTNPFEMLELMRRIAVAGARGAVDVPREYLVIKIWSQETWWVIYRLAVTITPGFVLWNFSVFIPALAVMYLIYVNNASGWANRDWRNHVVLSQEQDNGKVAVIREDGSIDYEEVWKPLIPKVHRKYFIPLTIGIIIGYIVLAWAVYGGQAAVNEYDQHQRGEKTVASEIISRPIVDGRHTPIGVAPREPWYTLKRMTETELSVLVFHAAIIGMVLLAMLFSASQPWRGYAAFPLVIIPALYYREWVALGIILLALIVVYSAVKPRAALAPA